MTKDEKAMIARVIRDTQSPSVPNRTRERLMTTYDSDEAIDRLLESPDFQAGWDACRDRFLDVLEFILKRTPQELRRFAPWTR